MPLDTAAHSIRKARAHRLRVILDPGGIVPTQDVRPLLEAGLYCIKPNEHEARILTGIEVIDLASADRAAGRLLNMGIRNVLITHGAKGAYFFDRETALHIPVPSLATDGEHDETGCGDQAT